MIHTFIGNLGHLLVIIAFVTSMVAAFSYWHSSRLGDSLEAVQMKKFARMFFVVHSVAVIGIVASLFYIIYNHYYEYHYAWSHSSNNLPTHFMISCFWEGQEGSFLLWIFWHVLIGLVLIKLAGKWENEVMSIFTFVQAFLVSMILGVVFFDLKIGSSPFILLRDVSEAPIFLSNPDYIPEDGSGLNPLLQNYWMVIHPPTLFLGFAGTLVPFAYCMAGLWKGNFKEWVKPALPWAQITALILGLGIMMGAYWAYETLNFGGMWNWDPVENAVYIPWIILVAAIHLMVVFRKSGAALTASMILVIASFVLVLYATFLTRSGILGEASVHSFTDLGLSGQLLLYLLAFAILSVYLLVRKWKVIPKTNKEIDTYTSEFWIFIGATVLCLSGFQVLVPTSIPVFNSFLGIFGIESNMAPPADQVMFYTKFQLWFGVGIALLSGTAQFFWWGKMDKQRLQHNLSIPLLLTFTLSGAIIMLWEMSNWQYIVLLTTSIYAVISNLFVLFRLAKKKVSLSGGAVAHIGISIMLIGILFSSGYSKTVSMNNTGLLYNREFSDEMNKENLLLFRNEPSKMSDYQLAYKGQRIQSEQVPGYIDTEKLMMIRDPYKAIAREDLVYKGQTYAKKGDTIQIYNENTYYEIEYAKDNGEVFTLYPRIQNNPQMGYVPSPDINTFLTGDLYTHITNIPDPESEEQWSDPETHELSLRDTFFVNDYVAILDNVVRTEEVVGVNLGEKDVAVKAQIRVFGENGVHDLNPVYLIKNMQRGVIPEVSVDLGIRINFDDIDPQSQKFTFTSSTTQKDWVILKALEKPHISFVWIGTILMCIGLGLAFVRRTKEAKERKGSAGAKKRKPSVGKEVVS
ncbi:cytochrome c biogenesis protein CcsA [Flammeovirgaceae bacterium SG7u.111]|nr:cytochrome c biogenesis protein CcsA [Flammeovirgaceae bacterium SG7u.132]WPO35848.1 cytochrome c biogenesis protein CcsA [Flammeovirgaceae bacterium SG7u.111]